MKITVAGTGYVGLSLAVLFAEQHEVVAFDIDSDKVNKINQRISPIQDEYIEKYLSEKQLNLTATTDYKHALKDADFVIISTPTNYDDKTNHFDTSSVEDIIQKTLKNNPSASIIIKSTIPVGYTERIQKEYNKSNIFFSPEFLREGHALYDNLYPSRIIIGGNNKPAQLFAELLKSCAKNNPPVLFMKSTEAEAVKLFANTFLALRIAYFNELDTYAEIKQLNTHNIIEGVSLDPRIGNYYNNPSFGYGGYCLPKDTKQLLSNYNNVPQNLIEAIIKANRTRKLHITRQILEMHPNTVGIYRLTMKSGSDNFRSSAIQDIISNLRSHNIKLVIYEPSLDTCEFGNCPVEKDFDEFVKKSSLIIANRIDKKIAKFKDKVYTRDLFMRD